MTPTEKHSAFVGICPGCRRIVFASVIVDDPARRKEDAREVAKLIRAGIRVETWDDMDKVRQAAWMCECPGRKNRKAANG
jgi:hypothetical protein